MAKAFNYLKTARSAEVTMMLGFPATGILFAFSTVSQLLSKESFFFMIAIFFLSSAIYSFNALSGIKEDESNERLKKDLGPQKKVFFIVTLLTFILLFIVFFYIIDLKLVFLSIFSFLLWSLYSFPRNGLKYKPVFGTTIHFVGQIIHFHMGYIIIDSFSLRSFLISIYFAILFASGHINHELIDYEADKKMKINSGAVYFGKKVWEKLSCILFLISTIYITALIFSGIVNRLHCLPFAAAGTVHLLYRLIFLKDNLEEERFLKERFFYRIAYFTAGLCFLLLKLVF